MVPFTCGVSVFAGLNYWTGLLDSHNFMQKRNYSIISDCPPPCLQTTYSELNVELIVLLSVQMETLQGVPTGTIEGILATNRH